MNLEDKYPGTDPKGLKLLRRMLWFNPETRITAEEALCDSYFDDVRLPEQEVVKDCDLAHCEIDDKLGEDSSQELSMETLRQLILKELAACPVYN